MKQANCSDIRESVTCWSNRVSTFVQLAVDVLWELRAGFHIGGVNIECLTVGPSPLPLLHGLSANTQYGAAEVLNLWVLHHLKLTDWHPNCEACTEGWFQTECEAEGRMEGVGWMEMV